MGFRTWYPALAIASVLVAVPASHAVQPEQVRAALEAGADFAVVGNAIEAGGAGAVSAFAKAAAR